MANLMAVALGPVQDFIAAARRTRDLWFGSMLLSEISKSVASALQATEGVTLIFPSPQQPGDLFPGTSFSVSNILLAQLDVPINPVTLWPNLKIVAENRWRSLADEAIRDLNRDWLVKARWEKQLLGVVEFYAAWLPFGKPEQYQNTRSSLMRLLAGRKACRDFDPWQGEAGVPKSSLDGARETVLTELSPEKTALRASRIKLSTGEQLDAVGLVKRLGGTLKQYPSVSRVACDPWLRGLKEIDRERLSEQCACLAEYGLVRLSANRFPQYSSFLYEGAGVYLNQIEEAVEGSPEVEHEQIVRDHAHFLKIIYKEYGEPQPYLALLAADGDRMGEALSNIDKLEAHQAFSQALSRFAENAGNVISRHFGALVYSGGDDVLAFVPVDKAVACARALQKEFTDCVKGPTLSPVHPFPGLSNAPSRLH